MPSGINPLAPPNFNQRLSESNTVLEIDVPVTHVLSSSALLLHKNASWMSGTGSYDNQKQTRLGGLGPAIAQVNTYLKGQPWRTTWSLPLSQPCNEIVGNYAITNFPAACIEQTTSTTLFWLSSNWKLWNNLWSRKLTSMPLCGTVRVVARKCTPLSWNRWPRGHVLSMSK